MPELLYFIFYPFAFYEYCKYIGFHYCRSASKSAKKLQRLNSSTLHNSLAKPLSAPKKWSINFHRCPRRWRSHNKSWGDVILSPHTLLLCSASYHKPHSAPLTREVYQHYAGSVCEQLRLANWRNLILTLAKEQLAKFVSSAAVIPLRCWKARALRSCGRKALTIISFAGAVSFSFGALKLKSIVGQLTPNARHHVMNFALRAPPTAPAFASRKW